jgi:penicillin-binding protein 1A
MKLFSFRSFAQLALWGVATVAVVAVVATVAVVIYVIRVTEDLPEYNQLAEYQPPVMSRVHAGDGMLIAEYARERRVFVPVDAMPPELIGAFLSAEDRNFYSHWGVDPAGMIRAAISNIDNIRAGRRLEGGSTITQQVAKNFLLSSEQRMARKVQEMVLSMRMEQAFSKDQILELYLNEIFLGARAYGVAAAALNYFDKSLDELELHEIAYLAALPKAPNNYHPERRTEAAIARRNWVLDRMAANGYITREQAREAAEQPLQRTLRLQGETYVASEYFVEEVRRELFGMYGEDQLYEGGLSIRTTLDTRMQLAARQALRAGLEESDRRSGYRGPIGEMEDFGAWSQQLNEFEGGRDLNEGWDVAVALEVEADRVLVGTRGGARGHIPLAEMRWARPAMRNSNGFPYLGPAVSAPSDIIEQGDIIVVELVEDAGAAPEDYDTVFGLRQIPEVNGAVLALDPYTGRVMAMAGGYSFQQSQFNRATQARRQPGSSFKPFVYAAALDNGFTPVSIVLDAPFASDGGLDRRFYRPSNYSNVFYGPQTVRRGLELSRNVMTIRMAQDIGMRPIVDIATRLRLVDQMDPVLPMALGAGETTLQRMAAGYGALVNGGRYIEPTLIDRVQDRSGRTIYVHDDRECAMCDVEDWSEDLREPMLPQLGEEAVNPITAYQVVSMLEGAVTHGTGTALRALERPMGGKTGTTNEFRDAWFVGFSPDLVVGVYVGYDTPRPLGSGEAGGRTAAPIAAGMFAEVLDSYPVAPFRVAEGARLVPVNRETGELSVIGRPGVIMEAFRPGTEPRRGQTREQESLSFGAGALNQARSEQPDPPAEEDEDDPFSGFY